MHFFRPLLISCLAAGLYCHGYAASLDEPTSAGKAAQPIDFDRQIRPILSNACIYCHGPDAANRKADLRLDREETAKDYAIVPHDPDGSELLRRILSDDPDERMPPPGQKQQLTAAQIELLRQWIAEGARWSQHWSYVTPKHHPLPKVSQADWPQVGIDHFVLAQLDATRLKPSRRASRETLIRRVSLDLTGLPPTLAEVDAFLADKSPDAYEKIVDRLLASARYGEHMALPWLAAARYADTNGYQNDATRTMWPWRDWVIRAMNENMPFDEFTINQLAGDLLDNPTRDQLIATGFHRNHGLNGEGGRNPEESRVEYVIDRASTTGTVWLGLTVGCCRCHDHKYDDLTQKEFYELYAYFNHIDERGGVDAGGNAKPVLALPTDKQLAEAEQLQRKIAQLDQQKQELPPAPQPEREAWEEDTRHWLTLAENDQIWLPQKQNVRLETEHDASIEYLEDGSVLVARMADSSDDYAVRIVLPAGSHHALRIEAMKHPKLLKGLFSTGVTGGFSVTDLEVELDGEPIKLVSGETNVGGQAAIKGLLDKNRFTTWSVTKPKNSPKIPTWMGRFETPLETRESAELLVRMKHQSRTGDAPIGRFRISFTAYPQPTLKPSLGLKKEFVAAVKVSGEQRTSAQRQLVARQYAKFRQAPLQNKIGKLEQTLASQESKYLKTMVMRDRRKPRDTYQLQRGLWNQPDKSEKLQPGVFSCLPALPADAPSNRLALAKWLVRDDHPLTARVTVNRYWQQFFGVGLVKTNEDFGVQGERPTHPLLLDWLATEFVQSGWDVKRLHKLIVMSATYQQSSQVSAEILEADPYNRLLTRGPRFRLSAQSLRDQALALSGLLVEKQGGPGVMPYQPLGVWSDFSLGKIKYKQGTGDDLYRRSVYTFWRRPVGPTMFFDNAGRQVCTVNPALTNTPLHALTLLNDVTYVEAARAMAQHLLQAGDAAPLERIGSAFRLATSRRATAAELDSLLKSWQRLLKVYRSNPAAAAELVAVGESPVDEQLDVVELAAYTSLMNAILNLDEVVTKS